MLTVAPSLWAQLTKVDIAPTNTPPIAGAYTPGAGTAFSITSDGTAFFPPSVQEVNAGDVGDVMTFAYETITGDFDKRVKITGITGDAADTWTRGALQARTGTNSYSTSLQLFASNPQLEGGGVAGFAGRALDGQVYTWFSRNNYNGVNNALPNQWLRLRRVGDYFSAYVGTNGTSWTLIGQRYQKLPVALLVGPYAASGVFGATSTVNFSDYSNTLLTDAIAPALVSAGTLDKQVVGVKFSESVKSSTATVLANYQVTQTVGGGVTINSAQLGIAGDAVYLSVSGLTADNFSVTVVGGIQDSAGNPITPNQTVAARALNWNHGDIGYIQNTGNRPQPGDDPGTVGQAVMISSDENPEVEIVGGGSNSWNPGDFIHYIWRTAPLSGNFDVTVAVSRNDRPANNAGWGNSGIMLRASDYNPGDNPPGTALTNYLATQVPMVALTTYQESAGFGGGGPGRGAIPLWRTTVHAGYGNGNAGFGAYGNVIGGVKGYYSELRGLDASGNIDPQSVPDSARYLRIKRVGTQYTFYASWNRTDWALVDGPINLPDLPDQLLLGFSTMNDTGSGTPPFGGYGGNGHELDPADPYNPLVAGGNVQNESNYSVQRIKVFPNGVTDPVPAALALVEIRPEDESPFPPNALPGSWTSTGTTSFDMTGGGTGQFRNLPSPADGTSGGDQLSFAYETIIGDFDKQVNITSLTNRLYNNDGTAYDYSAPVVDTWARAGLMVRSDTNAYNQCLKIVAVNPAGANVVRVQGRGIDAQNYTQFSGDYAGVSNALPNQYLRMKRVGNSFSCYVSKDGVVWSLISERYQEMPTTVLFGPYCAAALDPLGVDNPEGLLSTAIATFTSYKDVDLGDVTGPALVSTGTLDKKTVGVKFNEKISSATATVVGNYTLSQGSVTGAKLGINGDSVYLTVSGLTADTFTVTVTNVTDTAGNKIAANSTVNGKASGWVASDIGYIQNPNARPTVGDDPYRPGQTVATSSDDAPEVEIIGGGSNAWNGGDYLHYVYNPNALTGDFDVAFKVSKFERPDTSGQGGYSWGGVELRQALYNAGEEYTVDGTKVPMIANTTYYNYAGGPGRSAIPLWRNDAGGGYGNGNAGFNWNTSLIGGIKGYFTGINATDSVGTADPESSPLSARWLRIKRAGTDYTFYASYNGLTWDVVDTKTTADITVTGPLLLGYATMTDAGAGTPPVSAYGGNGHTIDPLDPLNPLNAGGNVMNESNYGVQRVRLYPNTAAIGAISAAKAGNQVSISYAGTLVTSTSLNGPWTVVPQQSSPYLTTPSGSRFYRVIP